MDRARLFVSVAVVLMVATLAVTSTGALGGVPLLVAPPLTVVLGLVALRHQRVGGGLDAGWAGAGSLGLASPDPILVAGGTGTSRPAGAPARGSVARSLARLEARQLALNPWLAVGIGFWLIIILVLGVLFADDAEWSWWELFSLLPALAHPLVGCAVVAVHRGVTRARRDGAEELFTSCPADEAARTRGFLLTAWVPLVATWVCTGTLLVLLFTRSASPYGPIDQRAVVDLLVLSILPVGGTALGVALGRWAPWTLAPFVAVPAVAWISTALSRVGPSSLETERALVSWSYGAAFDPVFLDPPVWERLAWLGGLTVAVGAVALLRGRHSRRVPLALAGGIGVAVLAALSLFRPLPTSEAEALAGLVGAPQEHDACIPVDELVQVCVYEPYRDLGGEVADALAPVAGALPAAWSVHPITFRQTFDHDPDRLPAAVRRLLPARVPGPRGPDLYVGYSGHPDTLLAARFRLAARAMNLPNWGGDGATSVAGEARGVVALWLGVRGLAPDQARRVLTAYEPPEGDNPTLQGDIWPARCHGEEPPLAWSRQDLAAARALLELPESEVLAVVQRDLDRWRVPTVTTDELLAALGLDPVGPPDTIDPTLVDRCE